MEISSLIVLRMYPRHRNLEAKQIRGISYYTGDAIDQKISIALDQDTE